MPVTPNLQLLISDSTLLHYPRLLLKVTITFLEPALFHSAVVNAAKIPVPLCLLLCLMVTHSCVSLSSLWWSSKPFSASSSFSLLSHVLGTLFLSLPSQKTPQMDGASQDLCGTLITTGNSERSTEIFFRVPAMYHHDSACTWQHSPILLYL